MKISEDDVITVHDSWEDATEQQRNFALFNVNQRKKQSVFYSKNFDLFNLERYTQCWHIIAYTPRNSRKNGYTVCNGEIMYFDVQRWNKISNKYCRSSVDFVCKQGYILCISIISLYKYKYTNRNWIGKKKFRITALYNHMFKCF